MVEARKLCGKTQEAVAKEVGISTLAFQRYEGGQRTPNVTTAIRIADALGEWTLGYYLVEEGAMRPERFPQSYPI